MKNGKVKLVVFDKDNNVVFDKKVNEKGVGDMAYGKLREIGSGTAVAFGDGWVHIYTLFFNRFEEIELNDDLFHKIVEVGR